MILAVDAGNSRTKWGLFDASGALQRHGAMGNQDFSRLLQDWSEFADVRRAVISCVAGEDVAGELKRVCDALHLSTHWVSAGTAACGVRNGYARPQQLGTDRWAALVAAWHEYRGACVVASAGTALTVDVLAGDGTFLGGLIVPGLGLMRAALRSGTAAVGEAGGQFCDFPTSTADAVHSGALAAMGGAVRHMMHRLEAREGKLPHCLLAGGDAKLMAPLLDFPVQARPHLVLHGLFLLETAAT